MKDGSFLYKSLSITSTGNSMYFATPTADGSQQHIDAYSNFHVQSHIPNPKKLGCRVGT